MSQRILLASCENMSMLSTWRDELYCTKRKDGTYSLRVRKSGDGGRHWFPGITRIKSARQFIDSINSIDVVEIDQWNLEEDILPQLSVLDATFAESVRNEIRIEENAENTASKLDQIIAPIIRRAEIEYPNGVTNSRLHTQKVWKYVSEYLGQNEVPPKGHHIVGGLKVIFCENSDENR